MPPSEGVPLTLPPPPVTMGGRLHPAALLLTPLAQSLPTAALLLAGRTGLAIVLFVGASVTGAVRWLRFSWRVEHGAFVVEQGLLTRQRRVIPLERVQRVDLSRSLRHRLLGVVELRVEAVGGSDTEGKLDALTVNDATALRRVLLQQAGSAHSSAGATLVTVRPGRLVVAGVTGGRVGVVAALIGAADQVFGDVVGTVLERVPLVGTTTALALATAAVVVVFVLAVVATVVANWNFTLTTDGTALRIRRGLLQQRLDTVPLGRIQALRIEENIVRRALGLARVTVEVAGQAGQAARETGVLLPIGSRGEADELVTRVLDEPLAVDTPLHAMPRAARNRRLVRAAAGTAAVTAAAVVAAGPVGLVALPVVGTVAGLLALAAYRALGHAEVAGLVVARSGVLVRRTTFVPRDRVQVLSLRSTWFQRRRQLATLTLHVARSPGGQDPALVDVAVDDARRQLVHLSQARAIVHP